MVANGWWLRAQVSRNPPPPLPGGYRLGEKVFFTGRSFTYENYGHPVHGHKWVHGQQGEVTGPASSGGYKGKGLDVLFPGNLFSLSCFLTAVRRLRAAFAAPTASPTLGPVAPTPYTQRAQPHVPSPAE